MKVKILTHNSGEYETDVLNFNEIEIDSKLNDPSLNTVLIGKINISRIDVKLVIPLEQ